MFSHGDIKISGVSCIEHNTVQWFNEHAINRCLYIYDKVKGTNKLAVTNNSFVAAPNLLTI